MSEPRRTKAGENRPADDQARPKVEMRDEAAEAKLLELLVCPLTKTTLHYDKERQELVSRAAGVAYPIRDGVPVMTEDAARRLDPGPKVVGSG